MSSIFSKWGRDAMEGALTAPSVDKVLSKTNEVLPTYYAPIGERFVACVEHFQHLASSATKHVVYLAGGTILIGGFLWIQRYLFQHHVAANGPDGVDVVIVERYDDDDYYGHLSPGQRAAKELQHFIKFNQSPLQRFRCKITEPIRLGDDEDKEGTVLYLLKMPEGATFYDLAKTGVHDANASVHILRRLKQEFSLVEGNDVGDVYGIERIFKDGEDKDEDKDDEPEQYKAGAATHKPIPRGELVKANAFLSIYRDIIQKKSFLPGGVSDDLNN